MKPNLPPPTFFGNTPEIMDSCARQVLEDKKHATTGLLAAYLHDQEPLPQVGQRWTVRDGRGRDVAIIETVAVEIRRYCDVDAAYAAVEGEGDGSLKHWQDVHWAYLGEECLRVGHDMNESVELVLETFRLERQLMSLPYS